MFNVERLADERKHQTVVTLPQRPTIRSRSLNIIRSSPCRGTEGAFTFQRLGNLSAKKRNWYLTALSQ